MRQFAARIPMRWGTFVALLSAFACSSCVPVFRDISPDLDDANSAGLMYALANSGDDLYAISLNAGVWRSNTSTGSLTWTQLPGPRHAQNIAVDPGNPWHIAVGERDGFASDVRLNESGVWESWDKGQSWRYSLNPLSLAAPGTCSSQVVLALIFAANRNLIASTDCGVAYKRPGSGRFELATVPVGTGALSALTGGVFRTWGRTKAGELLRSPNYGQTFEIATTQPLPTGINFSFGDEARGDEFSLAGSDLFVLMSVCCINGGPSGVNGHPANELLVYDVANDAWRYETFDDAAGKATNSGTYVGGRRFVRSFLSQGKIRYFFSNGQAVWETNLSGTHTLLASGVDIAPPSGKYAGGIHSDWWDFAVSSDGAAMWIAGDGGISQNLLGGLGWKNANRGLHTLHVQSLNVVHDPAAATQVVFASQDNGGWYGIPGAWKTGGLGDANFADTDTNSRGRAFLFRSAGSFNLASLDGTSADVVAPVQDKAISIIATGQPDRPLLAQLIQGTAVESGNELDAIMVVDRPVLVRFPTPFRRFYSPAGSLAAIGQNGNPWLLRNKKWADEPDFYRGVQAGNWTLERNDLPTGTDRVFASGGHANPHYFALVRDISGLSLFEQSTPGSGVPWTRVLDGIIDWNTRCAPFQGWYGPVFVNPYDSDVVYALTPSNVLVSSRDSSGVLHFAPDELLTTLVTASRSFPIMREFCGGIDSGGSVLVSRLLGTSTLGHVSFNRDHPSWVLVTSPFTGVFYKQGTDPWRSLAGILPQAPAWAARSDGSSIYVGFAGRSVGKVLNGDWAPVVTYFKRETGFVPALGGGSAVVARLARYDGSDAPHEHVSVRIVAVDGTTSFSAPSLALDALGRVRVPLVLGSSGSVVHLRYSGGGGLASCEAHFLIP